MRPRVGHDDDDGGGGMFPGPQAGFLRDGLSSTSNNDIMRPPSQDTAAPTVTSSESPASFHGSLPDQRQRSAHPTTTNTALRSDLSPNHAVVAARQLTTAGDGNSTYNSQQHPSKDWPVEFSLEAKRGYSNHLIGLSCESDPFLLRHYRYNAYDNYHMFRLDFRKVVDDAKPQQPSRSELPNVPIQFMMCDETIWQDDVRVTERMLSGADGTEAADTARLNNIVNPELGSRLLKLQVGPGDPLPPVCHMVCLKSDCEPQVHPLRSSSIPGSVLRGPQADPRVRQ